MISSVNILFLNQCGPMNNIILLPKDPQGVHGDPSGPMDYEEETQNADSHNSIEEKQVAISSRKMRPSLKDICVCRAPTHQFQFVA